MKKQINDIKLKKCVGGDVTTNGGVIANGDAHNVALSYAQNIAFLASNGYVDNVGHDLSGNLDNMLLETKNNPGRQD